MDLCGTQQCRVVLSLGSLDVAVSLLSWVGWVVITRFKVKTQFKLDLSGTGTELSLAIMVG